MLSIVFKKIYKDFYSDWTSINERYCLASLQLHGYEYEDVIQSHAIFFFTFHVRHTFNA